MAGACDGRAVSRGLSQAAASVVKRGRISEKKWWAMRDSNSRHPRCKRGALPTELIALSRCEAMSAASVGVIYAQPGKTARGFQRICRFFCERRGRPWISMRKPVDRPARCGGSSPSAIWRCPTRNEAAGGGRGRSDAPHARFSPPRCPCGSKLGPSRICLQTRLTPKCEPLS